MKILYIAGALLLGCAYSSMAMDHGFQDLAHLKNADIISAMFEDPKFKKKLRFRAEKLHHFGLPKPFPDFRKVTGEFRDVQKDDGISILDLGYYAAGYDTLLNMCRWSMVVMTQNQFSSYFPERATHPFLDSAGRKTWDSTLRLLDVTVRRTESGKRTFDRGHMTTPSDVINILSDPEDQDLLQRGTYFTENNIQQPSSHNFGPWMVLEEAIRAMSKNFEALWVISGPLIGENVPKDHMPFLPCSFYKVLLGKNGNSLYVGAVEIPCGFKFQDKAWNWINLRRRVHSGGQVDGLPHFTTLIKGNYPSIKLPVLPFPGLAKKVNDDKLVSEDIWESVFPGEGNSWDKQITRSWVRNKNKQESFRRARENGLARANSSPVRPSQYTQIVSENARPQAPSPPRTNSRRQSPSPSEMGPHHQSPSSKANTAGHSYNPSPDRYSHDLPMTHAGHYSNMHTTYTPTTYGNVPSDQAQAHTSLEPFRRDSSYSLSKKTSDHSLFFSALPPKLPTRGSTRTATVDRRHGTPESSLQAQTDSSVVGANSADHGIRVKLPRKKLSNPQVRTDDEGFADTTPRVKLPTARSKVSSEQFNRPPPYDAGVESSERSSQHLVNHGLPRHSALARAYSAPPTKPASSFPR
ncbi:hypothetical protein BJ684DRAFT_15524 [Piptocephalis cylindrospora]|uniref:DNA/RNA non-specific endonuclease/pyrophosphatase/phosphodiesterase domain-containing protein n=1 Tax=Piptocephalis cylindrospora TaxID=1907219 RepID=A0A4P9Y7B7_9FUNG|nr:hypothetical protein BJ684DRAFT_15524 [Piptocephalis cylindrospora]|eukprot:RKP14131.1 hypothetical protein BJ684DRAFT_15524 [Piptocephalis cylindrospora]